jgi:hypothetical protein
MDMDQYGQRHPVSARRSDGHGRSDRQDYAESMKSARVLEERHGLTRWTPARESGRLAMTTAGERDRAVLAVAGRRRGERGHDQRVTVRA